MGITGLIPFMEKSSKITNISEFSGETVAIDTYCWLHRGAFSCADKLLMGQDSDVYIKYCMKYVNMLLSHNIKPILVFDGRYLPAKAETESKRRQTRQGNLKRAADLIKMGKIYEGKNLLKRSLDISHKMALNVIKECQARNIDCIVAPYEADAQLAYLNISGIADVVITEDSDLTLFGCKKIMFKMDLCGRGILVEQDRLHLAMGLQKSNFNIDKFRYMCILSGCDYLANIPGIGLIKACKFIVKNTDDNIYNALVKLQSVLNLKKSIEMTKEYRDNFMCALVTFKHQLVYCPLQRKQVRLNPPTPEVTEDQLKHAGTEVDEQLAWELALGNCDPITCEKMHDFNPDLNRPKPVNAWNKNSVTKHCSIWSKDFKINIKDEKEKIKVQNLKTTLPARTRNIRNQVVVMKTESIKKEITPKKRTFQESEQELNDIINMYKREDTNESTIKSNDSSKLEENTSPILVRRSNPFRKINSMEEKSPSLVSRVRRRLPIKSRQNPTVIDNSVVMQSKFFSLDKQIDSNKEQVIDVTESKIDKVSREDSKENMDRSIKKNIVVLEPEISEDEEMFSDVQDDNKDSGYKGSGDEKDVNSSPMSFNDSIVENKSFNNISTNSIQNSLNLQENSNEELKKKQNNDCTRSNDEKMDFSISPQALLETRSSLFKFERQVSDKKLKMDGNLTLNTSRNTPLQRRLSNRDVKTNLKKKIIIQGQQNLLSMFNYQKKESTILLKDIPYYRLGYKYIYFILLFLLLFFLLLLLR